MLERIVVPLDGSDLSEQVLPHAAALSRSLSLPVTLLEVTYTETGRWMPPPEVYETIEQEAAAYLENLEGGMRSLGIEAVDSKLLQGEPTQEILRATGSDAGTLVALATHGRSGLSRWALGSVTDRVIRHSEGPVLVVRSEEDRPIESIAEYSRIVVPLDGSPASREVIPYVVEISKTLGVPVTLCQVGERFVQYQGYWPDDPMITVGIEEHGREYLEKEAEDLRGRGIAEVDTAFFHGDPAESILSIGEHNRSVMIAMTTHGRAGVARWTLGSVTDRVVRNSAGPVLVVREQPRNI